MLKDYTDYMRALWKGAISFGLVTIPVSLYPATELEVLKFRLLRKSERSIEQTQAKPKLENDATKTRATRRKKAA